MLNKTIKGLFLSAALLAVSAGAYGADLSGSIQTKARILTPLSIVIGSGQAIDFGDMEQGEAKTVAPADGAQFTIIGESLAVAKVTIADSNMVHSTDATQVIPVTDPTLSGLLSPGTPSYANGVYSVNFEALNAGTSVQVGATATPAADQTPGTYEGTMTLTFAYVN